MTITLYRTVSIAEKEDFYNRNEKFATGRNTLEAKQFFKSKDGVDEFIKDAYARQYNPPYKFILEVSILKNCLDSIPFEEQELDRHKAITVHEDYLSAFNKCITFVKVNDI